jgi:putative toxin-antitoxin system antitoxin component (TIGR02293 family)
MAIRQTLREEHQRNRTEPLPLEDLRVARSLSKAIDTFEGDWEHAAEWMRTPNLALDNLPPFEVAQEPDGYDRVLAVLVRIDHGVYG